MFVRHYSGCHGIALAVLNLHQGEIIMRIFVTGASGFIGSAITQALIRDGHQVLGLTRSEAGAQSLATFGADVLRGDIEDLDSLRRGASAADAVIHTAFNHDFSRFMANCEADRHAIEAIGTVLLGSDRPFVITSVAGLGAAEPGKPATEDVFNTTHPNPRSGSEVVMDSLVERGVNVSAVRLPQVHDTFKQGLITMLIAQAREKGECAYVGEGLNRWAAVHLSDAVRVYLLAMEHAVAGRRYHAVAEEGVALRDIVAMIGRGLKLPVRSIAAAEAAEHFGWMGAFIGFDMPASSALTQDWLKWRPQGPGLMADLERMQYA